MFGSLFCTHCGARLAPREREGRVRQACVGCGEVAWENPVPAAAVVVRRGRQVLLCRRAIEPHAGRWGLPAGYQEIDETIETTAVREVREETGLVVRLTGLLDVLATEDPRKPSLLVVFDGEETDGELEPGSDADEVGFHALAALPSLGFAHERRLLERLEAGQERTW